MNELADRFSRASQVIRPEVRAMHAYVVQHAAGLIKLDAMENPFSLPPQLQQALGERLGRVAINRYPGASTAQLAEALKAHAQAPADCAITLGNGSDELISLLCMAVAQPGVCVMAPLPGFVMYEASARQHRLAFTGVPLKADFELDEAAMLAAIERDQPALIFLSYPNNPTGNLWDEAVIERIVAAAPGLVVMDEAYQPFAARDSMALMQRHPHLLVMRTMSKFGLAGVRIGYLLGDASIVGQIEKLRPPYNLSVLNTEAALFALEHAEVFAAQAKTLRNEREKLLAALAAMPGAHAFPSQGNMVLVRVADSAAAFSALKARGILVKNVAAMHPLLHHCLRLTIGTPQENQALIAALTEILQ